MIPFGRLVPAVFRRRDNRFRAEVTTGGEEVPVHVPNSGRLAELLVPGAACLVAQAPPQASRLTWGTLHLVEHQGRLVCINAHLANALFEDGWRRGAVGDPFSRYSELAREVTAGTSRFDFLLGGPPGRLWVEVKCVTLVGDPPRGIDDGLARFPDAPTERGARHVRELTEHVYQGDRAAVVFIVQREDAVGFAPHAAMDPQFDAAVRRAVARGVTVRCYLCAVSLDGMMITRELPALLQVRTGGPDCGIARY